MGKTFCIGDIHAGHKALIQCLNRCKFNNEKDTLIVLGDVYDGWTEAYQCVEELMKINNLVLIWGNHDWWAYKWLKYNHQPHIWLNQGGVNTIKSYLNYLDKKEPHATWWINQVKPYYIDKNNNLFVHGGIDWTISIEEQDLHFLMWDRALYQEAWLRESVHGKKKPFKQFNKIFIGHTSTTISFFNNQKKSLVPVKNVNVWNLDTGGGFEGVLSIMDINTEQYWQSDMVKTLYPDIKGR